MNRLIELKDAISNEELTLDVWDFEEETMSFMIKNWEGIKQIVELKENEVRLLHSFLTEKLSKLDSISY
jgi:hypothetical protein